MQRWFIVDKNIEDGFGFVKKVYICKKIVLHVGERENNILW
jgi:hypothetical protein